jgi:folate-dependent phosphoribosylglycinamide formyltransferase PurN
MGIRSPRPWILLSSSTGETFRALWKNLSPEARSGYTACFTDRPCSASLVSRAEAPDTHIYELGKTDFEAKLSEWMQKRNFKDGVLLLCGYFGILSKDFVEKCESPMVNTHPSLLPSYPGLDKKVHAKAFEDVPVSGFTVHLVNEKLDGGPILYQHPVYIAQCTSPDEARNTVRAAEKKYLPRVFERVLRSELKAADRNVSGREARLKGDFAVKTFEDLEAR